MNTFVFLRKKHFARRHNCLPINQCLGSMLELCFDSLKKTKSYWLHIITLIINNQGNFLILTIDE